MLFLFITLVSKIWICFVLFFNITFFRLQASLYVSFCYFLPSVVLVCFSFLLLFFLSSKFWKSTFIFCQSHFVPAFLLPHSFFYQSSIISFLIPSELFYRMRLITLIRLFLMNHKTVPFVKLLIDLFDQCQLSLK